MLYSRKAETLLKDWLPKQFSLVAMDMQMFVIIIIIIAAISKYHH